MIDRDFIYKNYSEEDIFRIVFKEIDFNTYYLSPFRKDNTPNCYFKHYEGKLYFHDWGADKAIDAIEAVMQKYRVTFIEALYIIHFRLKGSKPPLEEQKKTQNKKPKFKIKFVIRDFNEKDKEYWLKFGITIEDLKKDKVSAISKFKLLNTRSGDYYFDAEELAYVYRVNDGRKIYQPYAEKRSKFFSSCTKNDIGNIDNLPFTGKYLIITKAYKESRLLTNHSLDINVWLQSETQFPNRDVLSTLCIGFKVIYIFFDNDKAGKENSIKLKKLILKAIPTIQVRILVLKNDKHITDCKENKSTEEFEILINRIKKLIYGDNKLP